MTIVPARFARHIIQSITIVDKGPQYNRLLLNRRMRVVTSGRDLGYRTTLLIQRTVNGPQLVIATDLLRARHNECLLSIEELQLALRHDSTRRFVDDLRQGGATGSGSGRTFKLDKNAVSSRPRILPPAPKADGDKHWRPLDKERIIPYTSFPLDEWCMHPSQKISRLESIRARAAPTADLPMGST